MNMWFCYTRSAVHRFQQWCQLFSAGSVPCLTEITRPGLNERSTPPLLESCSRFETLLSSFFSVYISQPLCRFYIRFGGDVAFHHLSCMWGDTCAYWVRYCLLLLFVALNAHVEIILCAIVLPYNALIRYLWNTLFILVTLNKLYRLISLYREILENPNNNIDYDYFSISPFLHCLV